MDKREIEQFEIALGQAAREEAGDERLGQLVHTARQAMLLSETPPPPPHGLMPGRQRFLGEAVRLRAEGMPRRRGRGAALRWATALAMLAIALGSTVGVARVAAGSLPGQPLYGLKLGIERVRLALTTRPESRAALQQDLAEERLDEIAALLGKNQEIGDEVLGRSVQQLDLALVSAAQLEDRAAVRALTRLAEAVWQREQAIAGAAGNSVEPPVQELVREMERVRQEAHAGEGDPEGLRQRLRQGTPAGPTAQPGVTQTSEPAFPGRTGVPSQAPDHTRPTALSPGPSGTPGPLSTSCATQQPSPGLEASCTPGLSATPQPSEPPDASHTPKPNGTEAPGPSRTPGPGQTPGGGGNKNP